MRSFKLTAIMALSIFQLAQGAAAPRAVSHPKMAKPTYPSLANGGPQLIPGPGMPSLASTGLTNDIIFDPAFKAAFQAKQAEQAVTRRENVLAKRWTDTCTSTDLGSDVGAYACSVYLNSLGTTGCGVNSDGTIMCQAEYDGIWTYVGGFALTGSSATSYCRDVAVGAEFTYSCEVCGTVDCPTGSLSAAYGNGNLIVYVYGTLDE